MQLAINQPSGWAPASVFKPFLLVGVAAISSAALYSPLSYQSQNLKDKVNDSTLKPIIPYTEKGIEGSKKLFETLGGWAKAGANSTDQVKDWIKSIANGNVPNGAREIYSTLEKWAIKVYEFLKELLTEKAWENFKKNVKKLGQFLNLFKNLMKAELGGRASIFEKVLGDSELMEAMGELAGNNPELLDQLNSEDVENIGHALRGDKENTKKVLQEMAERKDVTPEKLNNALKQATLIGKIEKALDDAEKIKAKGKNMTEEDKKEGQKVLQELESLHKQVEEIITKATKSSKK